MRNIHEDLRAAVEAAVRQGWNFQPGGHRGRLYPPQKDKPFITIPAKLGDKRGIRNKVAQLRRAGVKFPH